MRTSVNHVFQTLARDMALHRRSYRGVMRRVRCGMMGAECIEKSEIRKEEKRSIFALLWLMDSHTKGGWLWWHFTRLSNSGRKYKPLLSCYSFCKLLFEFVVRRIICFMFD